MKKIFFSLLLMSSLSYSQTEKKLGDFYKVTAFDQIEVELIPSKENKVVFSGTNAEQVEVINKNGELKIRMPLTKIFKGNTIQAKVYYTKIQAIEANEGSQISTKAVLKATAFEIIAKEGAHININLEASKLKAKISTGGIVLAEGKVKNQAISINTGGSYHAKELETTQTTISVNAGGEAVVFATEFADAKVRVGGTISVYGNPEQVDQKTIAGGKIEVVE
jgi:hypothetical protein